MSDSFIEITLEGENELQAGMQQCLPSSQVCTGRCVTTVVIAAALLVFVKNSEGHLVVSSCYKNLCIGFHLNISSHFSGINAQECHCWFVW